MTVSTSNSSPVSEWRAVFGPFASHLRLTGGIVVGLLLFILWSLVPIGLERSTRANVCWDVTCLWFVLLTMQHMRGQKQDDIRPAWRPRTKTRA